jgi:hypothetical protein
MTNSNHDPNFSPGEEPDMLTASTREQFELLDAQKGIKKAREHNSNLELMSDVMQAVVYPDLTGNGLSNDDKLRMIDNLDTVFDEVERYYEENYESHSIEIEIEPQTVLEWRGRIIPYLQAHGSNDNAPTKHGWQITRYGKVYSDSIFARGVEIWYPGEEKLDSGKVLDFPVHINLIEDLDVEHQSRNLSLTRRGSATSSVSTDRNIPETKMWLDVVRDIPTQEWETIVNTILEDISV